jgi:hypothetical protein
VKDSASRTAGKLGIVGKNVLGRSVFDDSGKGAAGLPGRRKFPHFASLKSVDTVVGHV